MPQHGQQLIAYRHIPRVFQLRAVRSSLASDPLDCRRFAAYSSNVLGLSLQRASLRCWNQLRRAWR